MAKIATDRYGGLFACKDFMASIIRKTTATYQEKKQTNATATAACQEKTQTGTTDTAYYTSENIIKVGNKSISKKIVHLAIKCSVSAALMMLFRHNGVYAYFVFAVVFLIIEAIKSLQAKRPPYLSVAIFAIIFLASFILYKGVDTGLTSVLHAESGEHQEILTVPIQQLGRVYQSHEADMSQEDKEILYRYISEEGLSHYAPRLSDILKLYFDNEEYASDSSSFWNLYFKYAKKYPATYINAWFLTSYGYWYPGAVINVYQGNTVFTFTYTDSSYFGYEVEQPGTRTSFIPFIDAFYRKLSIEKFQQNIPVISLFFSPAAYFWFEMLLAFYALTRKKGSRIIVFGLPLLVWATALLGPTYLVRYVIILWYILPVLMHEITNEEFHYTLQGRM